MNIEKQFCDCGEELVFDGVLEKIDRYENKVLALCKFHCPSCYDEYEINIEFDSSYFEY